MGEIDDKKSMSVINYDEMTAIRADLENIVSALQGALEKASDLAEQFSDAYIGEASEEVEAFLVRLPSHIERLILLYIKMGLFTLITAESFQGSDKQMAQKMEN